MQEQLDELAKTRGYRSRSEVIVRLLEWGLQELEREAREAALIAAAKQPHHGSEPLTVTHVEGATLVSAGDQHMLIDRGSTDTAANTTGRRDAIQLDPPPVHRPASMNASGGGTWGLPPREERKKEMRKAHVERASGTEVEAAGLVKRQSAMQRRILETAEKSLRKQALEMQALGHPVADIAKALRLSEARVRELLEEEHFKRTR
jgi:Arc/MetJ-type ribon-helix-helix transcriptional regulator